MAAPFWNQVYLEPLRQMSYNKSSIAEKQVNKEERL